MRAVTATALVVVAPLLAAGCVTTPAVEPGVKVRPETRPECAAHCETLGMRLAAIVLIRNAAGCVCEPREAPPAPDPAWNPPPEAPRGAVERGGAAVAGGAVVIALEEERRHREEAQRRDDEDRRRRDDEDRRRREEDARRHRTTP